MAWLAGITWQAGCLKGRQLQFWSGGQGFRQGHTPCRISNSLGTESAHRTILPQLRFPPPYNVQDLVALSGAHTVGFFETGIEQTGGHSLEADGSHAQPLRLNAFRRGSLTCLPGLLAFAPVGGSAAQLWLDTTVTPRLAGAPTCSRLLHHGPDEEGGVHFRQHAADQQEHRLGKQPSKVNRSRGSNADRWPIPPGTAVTACTVHGRVRFCTPPPNLD